MSKLWLPCAVGLVASIDAILAFNPFTVQWSGGVVIVARRASATGTVRLSCSLAKRFSVSVRYERTNPARFSFNDVNATMSAVGCCSASSALQSALAPFWAAASCAGDSISARAVAQKSGRTPLPVVAQSTLTIPRHLFLAASSQDPVLTRKTVSGAAAGLKVHQDTSQPVQQQTRPHADLKSKNPKTRPRPT